MPPRRSPSRLAVRACLALMLLWVCHCGDDDDRVVNTGSSLASGSFDYGFRMKEVGDQVNVLVRDYDDLLQIWEATHNVEYTKSQTQLLLSRLQTLLRTTEGLHPSQRQRQAHDTYLLALRKLESVFSNALRYLDSQGTDQNALLAANVAIVEFNRLVEQYNEQKG